MEDTEIINLYFTRNPDAITHSKEKYESYCFSVANNILENIQDSEECVNDTWLHTWNEIPPCKPKYFRLFLAKITRNLAFNKWNHRYAKKRGGGEIHLVLEELSQCISKESDVLDQVIAKELGKSIEAFVRNLPTKEGDIFIRRYFFSESISQIASSYGLTKNNTMVTLSRTRKKLKLYLIQEGY